MLSVPLAQNIDVADLTILMIEKENPQSKNTEDDQHHKTAILIDLFHSLIPPLLVNYKYTKVFLICQHEFYNSIVIFDLEGAK